MQNNFLRMFPLFCVKSSTNSKIMNIKFFCFTLFSIFCSCASNRNFVYFSDLKDINGYSEEIKNKVDFEIQPDDLLSISVNSLNPESNILFNNGVMQTPGSPSASTGSKISEGYLVDKDGAINFPVLGTVKLAGLTREEATAKIIAGVSKSVKNPIININYLNFRITVIGEVNHPATFMIANERVSLIEALSLAGDLTPFGRRDNILVIREKYNVRNMVRINLSNKSAFDSPAFYLQQNDVIYVEPVKARNLQTSTATFYLPIVSFVLSILSVVVILRR